MQAKVGDQLVVEGRTVGAQRREGEVLEVRGTDGAPPYVVRWSDGHEGLSFPGPDAHVVPAARGRRSARRSGRSGRQTR
jgi:Domain of unknown function (DUF1918)